MQVNAECMSHLFKFAYTGRTGKHLTPNNLLGVLQHADQFMVDSLRLHCYRRLADELTPANALLVHRFSKHMGHSWLARVAKAFVLRNFKQVVADDSFLELDFNEVGYIYI